MHSLKKKLKNEVPGKDSHSEKKSQLLEIKNIQQKKIDIKYVAKNQQKGRNKAEKNFVI